MFKAEILTLPPKSPIENVGLGPATQDSRTQKNGCFVIILVLATCNVSLNYVQSRDIDITP